MRGHIHKRERQGKNGRTIRWYVVVDIGKDENGKRKQKWHGGFRTRREAERAMAEIVESLDSDRYIAPQKKTLAEFVTHEWLPLNKTQTKTSTWDSYRRNLENHVLPVLGGTSLQQITAGHLDSLYRSLLASGRRNADGGLSPKTVRNIHGTLSKVFTDATDLGILATNPAAAAHPPKPRTTRKGEIRFWTPEELTAFLRTVRSDHFYPLWHLASMTGMRRGELLGLRWSDLDLEAQRLSVRQNLISVAYEIKLTTPKSHHARVINLDEKTTAVLSTHRAASEAAGALADANALAFLKSDGEMIHPDILSQRFERLVERTGLRRIRLHDLRHTHATMGLRAGVPVKVMSERLGHSTPAFTLQQYSHVIPGMQAEAAEAIAGLVNLDGNDP